MGKIAVYAVQALIVCWSLLYVIPAVGWPQRYFGRFGDPDGWRNLSFFARWKIYTSLFSIWIGLFILAFYGAEALIGWIPFDWGGHDEDGEWQSARPYVQSFIALFFSVGVMVVTENLSEAAAKRSLDERLMWAMVHELKQPPYPSDTADTYRRRIHAATEKILTNARQSEGSGLREYRDKMRWFMTLHDLKD